MKQNLLDKLNIFLLKRGFTIKNLTRTCFDILARRNEQILLIKVLEDANSITREYAEEMMSIASYIEASPLILAEKAGDMLDDNIVYLRFDIYTLNYGTFLNCVSNKFPFLKRSQAGLTASVVGKKLKEKREEMGYSLNSLSKKIGVTSRMIVKYENENSEITINRAKKLYDIILTEVSDKVNPQMQSLSKLLDADNLVIFSKKKPKNIPSMTKKEFMEFAEANELVKFLKEF